MEVDAGPDVGVEEKKGEESVVPAAAAAVAAERTQKGKGEGDRNIMLHPVCVLPTLWCIPHAFVHLCGLGQLQKCRIASCSSF